jgi:hypothetical protein
MRESENRCCFWIRRRCFEGLINMSETRLTDLVQKTVPANYGDYAAIAALF